jgi:hypothetical protein
MVDKADTLLNNEVREVRMGFIRSENGDQKPASNDQPRQSAAYLAIFSSSKRQQLKRGRENMGDRV